MTVRRFLYYGYDRDTYQGCLDQICATNRRHAGILNLWFLIINALFLACSKFNLLGIDKRSTIFYLSFFIAAAIYELLLHLAHGFAMKHWRFMIYIHILMFMYFSIKHSEKQPYLAATMFLVLVVLVALSYIDEMLRMSLALILCSGWFVANSLHYKPSSIATQDIYNMIVFLSLALVLHYAFQHARMHEFETYLKNIRIQRELEVKSSFDALTSLLNRGRFFAMASDVLRETNDEYMAICLLDLDGFKQINDIYGHQMGDKVIQLAGSTILNTMQIDLTERWSFPERAIAEHLSFAGRLGGDEFIVFVRGQRDQESVLKLLHKVLETLNSVELEDIHGIHASFGVTELSAEDRDIDQAYNRADAALYTSKRAGKNQISINNDPVGEDRT